MMVTYDAVALFSGGLDSILAARLIQDQGLAVKCIHFTSPFFGKPESIPHWREVYGLDIDAVDVGDAFAAMLAERPAHGFGKVLNPCVDCKILMMRRAVTLMRELGADILISGEVLGQRPMSQRKDTLNIIRRDAGVRDVLIRPLSARILEETPAEASGRIDRSRLGAISGRGRRSQLELAAALGITEIPTPAGGCRLTEKENGRSYWPVLLHTPRPTGNDFDLAATGRQYWNLAAPGAPLHLCVGRNQADNARLLELALPGDIVFKIASFPGPVALGRPFPGQEWDDAAVASAAAFTASFSPKAARFSEESGKPVFVKAHKGPDHGAIMRPVEEDAVPAIPVIPARAGDWREYPWEKARGEIRAEQRERLGLPPKEQPFQDEDEPGSE
ncbi:Thiamine biosynthesis protein [uncultured delta proteobacterium]|uniref:Thiamine biosynthesis protein n=1 Tax=uncultured delta proteobacterium TaxID=34034 RepID=A0A212KDD0_9DELT|nr:Thiamine biosynthesis protein [uncultured delta proteobacterium]